MYTCQRCNAKQLLMHFCVIMMVFMPCCRPAGTLPSSLSKLRFMRWVYLSMNKLQGNIPLSYSNMSLLLELDVTDNAGMGGCAPLSPSTNLEFSGTQITGLCSGDREQVEQQEQAAMWEVRSLGQSPDVLLHTAGCVVGCALQQMSFAVGNQT